MLRTRRAGYRVERIALGARRVKYAALARLRRWRQRFRPTGELLVYAARPDAMKLCSVSSCEGVSFHEVNAGIIDQDPERYSSSAKNARMCLAGGGRCFVGLAGPEVVLRMWTILLDESATGRLAPGISGFGPTAFVHDCWTSPDFRGRSIYPSGLRWMMGELGATGTRQLIMTITPGNAPAMRACEKAGFSMAGVFRTPERSTEGEGTSHPAAATPARTASVAHQSVPRGEPNSERALAPAALLEVLADVIRVRGSAWIVGTGHSMFPTLSDGDAVLLGHPDRFRLGDVVLFAKRGLPVVHRIIEKKRTALRTRGDAARLPDAWIEEQDVIAVALATAPYEPGSTSPQIGFRLIASAEGGTRLGAVTPLSLTHRYGFRAIARFVASRGVLAARRTLLLLRWKSWKSQRTRPRDARSNGGRQ